MKHYQSSHIKNIVLAGSPKSGKTTLAECMMFEGGVINRMGNVDDGNTVSDFHELEQERKNSVFSSIMHTEWRGTKINIVDTPGMDDFAGELISALRVADTALVTLNAQHGPEVGTEIIWRYLKKYNKPSIFVVNQLDHPKADWNLALERTREQFGTSVVVMQFPYNAGEGFDAIIDVLKMVMYKFPAGGGKPEKHPIPDDARPTANELHNTLVEAAAEHDEALMELYFEKGELDEDEMRQGLRAGMLNRSVFPLFCVSAKQNMGSGRMMGFIGNVAPTAGDMGPEHTVHGDEIKVSDQDTTLFIFKSTTDKHTGLTSFFKVCSGEISGGQELYNLTTHNKIKLGQLFVMDGKNRNQVDKLSAGDIGATVKLKDTFSNQTLRDEDDGAMVEPIVFPNSKIRASIVSDSQGDEEKLAVALSKIGQNDPTLVVEYAKELRQTIIHAQGELHLMTVKWLLKHVHSVNVRYEEPRISYRETIQKASEGHYRHKKQSGGSGQFGEVFMKVYPYHEGWEAPDDYKIRNAEEVELPWGGTLMFCNAIVGGVIDTRYLPAIQKGVMKMLEEGPITGSYARDVAVVVYDGKMHPVDSNEVSFLLAGQHAFKQAFLDAKPRLLEPIYKVDVLVPDEQMGDIMTDLQGRRAIVEGFSNEGAYQRITAQVPLAELYKYTTTLSSLTQGRATHTREFSKYEVVPMDIQQKLAASHAEMATAG
ncbi:MAG: elongation factor G [Bacteroidota bacterium]